MSEIAEIIDTLEGRLKKLLQKIDQLEQTSHKLQQELNKAAATIQNQSNEIDGLKSQYDTLKITSSLLGSDENKRETKLKINALIREIDYCIAQLAD
jgi:chromosome segregation ATPase